MRPIPKTVAEDGAVSETERQGQFNEQLAALNRDIIDLLDYFPNLTARSNEVKRLHESVRDHMDMLNIGRCDECGELAPYGYLTDDICGTCEDKFAEEELHEYAADDTYLGQGRYGRPRG